MKSWLATLICLTSFAVVAPPAHADEPSSLGDDTPAPPPLDDDDIPPPEPLPDPDEPVPGSPEAERARGAGSDDDELADPAPFGDGLLSPDVAPPDDAAPAPAARDASDDANASPWKISAGAGIGVSLGTAPGQSFDIVGAIDIGYRAFRVQIGGRYEFGAQVNVGPGNVLVRMGGADLALCGTYTRFFGCGLGFVGAMQATARGLYQGGTAQVTYFAAGARLGYEAQFEGAWSLRIVLDGYVPTTRTTFYAGEHSAWRTPPVAGTASFLVMYVF